MCGIFFVRGDPTLISKALNGRSSILDRMKQRGPDEQVFKKIDKTIDLLELDDFGYCETCGIEIGLRRLEARPTATQCVDCKALDEIKERQIHG